MASRRFNRRLPTLAMFYEYWPTGLSQIQVQNRDVACGCQKVRLQYALPKELKHTEPHEYLTFPGSVEFQERCVACGVEKY